MERWMEGLAEITRSVAAGVDDPTVWHVARSVVDRIGGPTQFLSTYETLATYHGSNYLPLMSSVFGAHRAALFRVLRALDLHSTSQDQTLVRAVVYVLANERRHVKYLPPLIALDFASEQWQRLVRTKQNGKLVYDRARLEMCVLTHVASRDALATTPSKACRQFILEEEPTRVGILLLRGSQHLGIQAPRVFQAHQQLLALDLIGIQTVFKRSHTLITSSEQPCCQEQ